MTDTPSHPLPAPSPAPFAVAPDFVLRVAGLPTQALAPLRAPGTAAWARTALELEDRLAALAPAAEDALAEAVSRTARPTDRRALLALRRDIHNARTPARATLRAAETLLPAAAADWLALRHRHEEQLALGERTRADELRAARRQLHLLAGDPVLRAGLQAASPSLDAALPAYLAAGDEPPSSKRNRKAERALVSYVYRTALKTSPFSTLTTLARGRFQESGPPLGLALADDALPRPLSRARPNMTALHEIAVAALGDPATRAALPFHAVGGWRRTGGRIHYVRRRYRPVDPGLALATPGVLEEEPFQLPAGPVLDEALRILDAAGDDGATLPQLAEALHRSDPDGRPRERLEGYLAKLVELGLLTTPAFALDIHHPDPVAELTGRLRSLGALPPTGSGPSLADRLDRIREHADGFPLAPLHERARRTAALRTEVAEAQRALGREAPVVPRTAVYEDAVLAVPATASRRAWEEGPLSALGDFARLLPAFDLLLLDRLLVHAHFRSRYGPGGVCDDVPGFAHELYRDCGKWLSGTGTRLGTLAADGTYLPRANPYDDPRVAALSAAHEEFARALRAALDAGSPAAPRQPSDALEVVLEAAALHRAAAKLPADGPGLPRSFSCYLQWAGPRRPGGRPLAVLNWAYSGLGQPLARFAGSFGSQAEQELTDGIRARYARLLPPDAVGAELSGGYDTSNLALRPAPAPYRLIGPAEAPHGPAERRLAIDDLRLVDDEDSGELRLVSRRLDKRVVPLWLGGLVPMALPRVQRTLLALSPAAMPLVADLWGCLEGGGPAHRPRVRHGSLVLARRAWRFTGPELPGPQPSAETAHGFLARRRWWRAAGLPDRVMARTDTDRKPQPVDADSPLSLSLLDHRLRGAGEAVFTELLPDVTEPALGAGGSTYVSEVCVELDAPPPAACRTPHTGRTDPQ
ncbi:lantibiotic dehydratase [Streptomyces sp. RK75]|uniref:lantibiotic dehydratase n=1 Tax=Streptomyces sp. RK75 TaxID=2824895 RepID=UPI001B366670|nr:lantibiotic dehydratase [Streptomyces sp. RK75]MBQ0866277.1 lantibiotic dehydratase [Streptomyces sp. RK75]